MDLMILPCICCAAAGIIVGLGAIVARLLAALVSRRSAILTLIWSVLPAAGLAVGAWAWWPALIVLDRVAAPQILWCRVDLLGLLYVGSPVVGTIAGITLAAFVARRHGARHPTNEPPPPDVLHPPDPGDLAGVVGDR